MRYKELIAKMTLEEKCSLLSGKDFWQTQDLPQHGIPSAFLADGPHGIRKQAEAADHLGLNESVKATCFPTAATMANSWNAELGEQMGQFLGKEARAQKVNVLLGPGLNIKRNPRCGRNFEYFSEDPYLAGKMAASYVRGIQSNGVSACLKHFAANNQETRRMIADSVIDERTLREIYLTGFEIAVKEGGAKTVMSAYNPLNGEYANENAHLLVEILRKQWGFDGVVVTDWGGANDRVDGLRCGNELEMPTAGGETNREVVEAIKNGDLDESVLDEAIDRLLTLIFDTDKSIKESDGGFDAELHHETAQRAAEESIVLLKNDADILPLKAKTKVAVIGDLAKNPRYQGAGSSIVNPTKVDSTLECIKDYDLEVVGFADGYNRYGKKCKKKMRAAVSLALDADVILLYMGLDEVTETEGLDRRCLSLPENQLDLLYALKGTGKKIVTVLSCGAVVDMSWADCADAVLHGYLGGQAGAKAMLNVIVGKVNPSGKLAESYPISYGDVPSASNFPGNAQTVEYREGLYVGYRYYDTADVKVRYPFGFGLSYTSFTYSDIKADKTCVTFTLTNTGNVAGAEVSQLYIGKNDAKVFRPKKELKGFCKTHLDVGESKTVTIPFDEYTFRYFDVESDKWEVEGGEYAVLVGASVSDIRLETAIAKDGTKKESPYKDLPLPSYDSGRAANVSAEEFAALLGRELPEPNLMFICKKRIAVGFNTAISDLRYARGWTGRFFAWGLRFADRFLRVIGKSSIANVLQMGVVSMPVRGLSRMTGGMLSWGQLRGLLLMFNGHFFKGFSRFLKEGKIKKRRKKTEKNMQKQDAVEVV